MSYLEERSEEDHGESSGDKIGLGWNDPLIDDLNETKADSSADSSVSDDELIVEWNLLLLVDKKVIECWQADSDWNNIQSVWKTVIRLTDEAIEIATNDCHSDEPEVDGVSVVDNGNSEVEEDARLTPASLVELFLWELDLQRCSGLGECECSKLHLNADVGGHVKGHDGSTGYRSKYSRIVTTFSNEVANVWEAELEYWLTHLVTNEQPEIKLLTYWKTVENILHNENST